MSALHTLASAWTHKAASWRHRHRITARDRTYAEAYADCLEDCARELWRTLAGLQAAREAAAGPKK